MKIAIDVRKVEDYGIGSYIFNILKEISQLDCGRNQYFLIGYNKESLPPLEENFQFVKTNAQKYSFEEHFKIPHLLKKINPEIFHSPHYVVPIFYKGKITVNLHDVIHILFPSYLPCKFAYLYAFYFIKRALKVSHKVITGSNSSKNDILRFFPWAENKIVVIYNGVDEEFFMDSEEIDVEKVKKELGRYILYVGNIKPHKNLKVIIEAMGSLREEFLFNFVVVGSSPSKELLNLIKKVNLNERVIFKNLVSKKELSSLYQCAEVFVFPSLYEGFGLPPLEAMAKGVSVLSSCASSIPEILKDAALYFDPYSVEDLKEKLRFILKDEDLRKRLSLKGREVARRYHWKVSAKKLMSLWEIDL